MTGRDIVPRRGFERALPVMILGGTLLAALVACEDSTEKLRVYCNDPRFCPRLTGQPYLYCLFDGDTGTYCALPDDQCASKLRWYRLSRPEIANQCVDPSLVGQDGGMDGSRDAL
jgi:hypothetical protein